MDSRAITDALNGLAEGDPKALDRILPAVYRELRQLAAAYLQAERKGHTLQPTALAHEAYLRLAGGTAPAWKGRAHFLGIAARVMREILVDHARRRKALKRGGGRALTVMSESLRLADDRPVAFDDLDRALQDLAKLSGRQARVVELRFFGGLTVEETAEVLGVSPVTVKRDWALARAWLYRELSGSEAGES